MVPCCDAWNAFINVPTRVKNLSSRPWANLWLYFLRMALEITFEEERTSHAKAGTSWRHYLDNNRLSWLEARLPMLDPLEKLGLRRVPL
jgi:hypothetical protein